MEPIQLFFGAIFGMAFAVVLFFLWENRKRGKAESKSEIIIEKAEKKREHILDEARKESAEIITSAKEESQKIMEQAQASEERIAKTEARVIEREEKIEQRLDQISKKQDELLVQEEGLSQERQKLIAQQEELDGKLSELAKLSESQARELYLEQIGNKYENDAKGLIEKHRKKIEKDKVEIAREILLKSIQQYAGDVTSEVTTTLIQIPSDDIKGKLIGKEGRNITTFEKNAGVSLIIDDTPDSVFISAFDLYRRYLAKKSLEKLIEDGRIQPARIEEVVKSTELE